MNQSVHEYVPQVLAQAISAWRSLGFLRKKTKRSTMFAFGDQWGDPIYVLDDNGIPRESISEAEFIYRQRRTPLKNNLIRPVIKNIEGQFRSLPNTIRCSVNASCPEAESLRQIANDTLNDLLRDNQVDELDPAALQNLFLSGFCAQRIETGFNPVLQKQGVWIRNCNPSKIFFNRNQNDVRGWDISLIGEIFDLPLPHILDTFSTSPQDANRILSYFLPFNDPYAPPGIPLSERYGRIYYVWKQELRPSEETGRYEPVWIFRYLTPHGYVLEQGPSPFPHRSHNYEIAFYTLVNDEPCNFVEDLIDVQKVLNRTLTEVNARLSASLKGLKIYDDQMFPGISPEELADLAIRTNGLLPASLLPGSSIRDSIIQCDANVNMSNDFQLIQSQIQLIHDVSGVSDALQGKSPSAGTSASLYAQESFNASYNIRGFLDTFRAFSLRRSRKALQEALPHSSFNTPSFPVSLSFQENTSH